VADQLRGKRVPGPGLGFSATRPRTPIGPRGFSGPGPRCFPESNTSRQAGNVQPTSASSVPAIAPSCFRNPVSTVQLSFFGGPGQFSTPITLTGHYKNKSGYRRDEPLTPPARSVFPGQTPTGAPWSRSDGFPGLDVGPSVYDIRLADPVYELHQVDARKRWA